MTARIWSKEGQRVKIGNKFSLAAAFLWGLTSGSSLLAGDWSEAFSAFIVTCFLLLGVEPAFVMKEEANDSTP